MKMYAQFRKRIGVILPLLLFILAATSSYAQNARFVGQVTDQQNSAIGHAAIEITNQDTGVQLHTETDASGSYTIPYLTAGRYRIVVEAPGFNVSAHDVSLAMGQAFVFNVQLTVGGAQSTVTVEGGSASVAELNTENAEVSGTITGKEVQGIQLNGRNFSQLIALAPGVSNQTQQDEARVGMAGSVAYSVNGGRTEYNSFQVDGSETLNVGINKDHSTLIVTPSIDAIQEIKVLTSNYGAQYPSTGNGTTIVTTKSGTDQYHGSVYEFFRNEDFNAKGYFDVGNSAPLYRRNDFGGAIGGPLSIPHVYNAKGKTHFFFSEEARIEKDPYAYRQAVPSLAERNGDFSDVCPAATNTGYGVSFSRTAYPDCPTDSSTSSVTFPNNQLTGYDNGKYEQVVLNQNAVALEGNGIFPLPNATSGCNSTGTACFNGDVSLPTYWREELFRIDHVINDKWQTGFRYIHDEWDETTPVPQYATTQNSYPTIQNRFYAPGMSYVARLTGAISPTFLNEFIASYTNSHITLADVAGSGVSLTRPAVLNDSCASSANMQCGMTTIFDNNSAGTDGVAKMPGISIAGNNAEYGGYGFAVDPSYMPWEHSSPTYSFADNLTKTWRQHNFQFGAQWVIFQRNQINGPIGAATGDTQGLLTFSNLKSGTGNSFADYLYDYLDAYTPGGAGRISTYQQDSGQGRYRQRYQIVEPYFQDDWKMTPRLTVNLGLRLSLFGTFHELKNNAYNWESSAFNTTTASGVTVDSQGGLRVASSNNSIPIYESDGSVNPQITNGIVQCGKNGIPSGCMSGHLFNPAPRVGFAWDPTGGGKTVLRGGYGIFFEHGTADEANTGSLEGGAPIVLSMTQINPAGWGTIGEDDGQYNNIFQSTAFPINVTAVPTKAVWSYVQQWSASIEHELPGNALVMFAYVGSKGTHLTAELETNQLTPTSSNPYGAHEPMMTKGANPEYTGDVGDCTATSAVSTNTSTFYLRNGTVVVPGDAGYNNLVAACYASSSSSPSSPNGLRTYAPGIGEIYSLQNVANSSYNAFQATLRKVQGPLTLGVAYTYSHSLDNASDRSDATFVNSFNLKGNRASSNFDQRHLLHVSYIYDLPLLKFFDAFLHSVDDANTPEFRAAWQNSHVIKAVLDGWQLSGLTIFETGIPFTVVNNGSPTGVSALDNAGVANGVGSGSYPDLSGISAHSRRPAGGNNSKSVGPLLLNPAAFIAPRGLTFGNAGRNDLNNPSRWNSDMAVLKRFPVYARVNAEFRAEAFNVFNTTQFRIYDPTLGNQAENEVSCYGGDVAYYSAAGGDGTDCLTGSSFLHPVDAHRPRTIQFALKLIF
ncbi:carboxypeptidase regulatory-like domain-containing protein [Telmatobacter bradus]|uniref:TonB-dependent receptor n=1 Tax=Telmatobacter bradus TaxID=474953 RepID=UPI003B43729C